MNNALKTLRKTTLCIKFLKNGLFGEMDGSVKAKWAGTIDKSDGIWEKKKELLSETLLRPKLRLNRSVLRRGAKEKRLCSMTVLVKQGVKPGSPFCLRGYAENHKIVRKILPQNPCLGSLNTTQIVDVYQFPMDTPEPGHNHHQPINYKPRRYVALRVYRYFRTAETRLTHLPTGNAQKERPDDCVDRVLIIGNQLDGQQREGASILLTKKPRNGDLLLLKLREKINGISPVGINFLITITIATDGTCGTNISQKIDPVWKESDLVFPNGFKFVSVGELDFLAALPTGTQVLGLPQTVWSASL